MPSKGALPFPTAFQITTLAPSLTKTPCPWKCLADVTMYTHRYMICVQSPLQMNVNGQMWCSFWHTVSHPVTPLSSADHFCAVRCLQNVHMGSQQWLPLVKWWQLLKRHSSITWVEAQLSMALFCLRDTYCGRWSPSFFRQHKRNMEFVAFSAS